MRVQGLFRAPVFNGAQRAFLEKIREPDWLERFGVDSSGAEAGDQDHKFKPKSSTHVAVDVEVVGDEVEMMRTGAARM